MKRFSEQLNKKANSMHLKASERADLRERLVTYMEYNPLPESVRSKEPVTATVRRSFNTFNLNLFSAGRYVGALAVLFLVVVPVVAEKAVPGDVLYPVKVRFNEELRGQLAFTPYQKIEWETERLERRISEARLLADAGKLTPEVEAEVAEAVKQHSDAAQESIASIRVNDSEEAAIAELTFASALEVQSEVLEGHMEKNSVAAATADGKSIAALAGAVEEVRASVATRPEEPLSYDKLIARIETETTRAYEYFDSIGKVASEDEKVDIERRLAEIRKKVNQAINNEDKQAATQNLAIALSDTRKLISFMTNIDVRENVSIDDLLPVVETDDERMAATLKDVKTASDLLVNLKARAVILPADLVDEVNGKLDESESLLNEAAVLLKSAGTKDLDEVETKVEKALNTLKELDALTKEYDLSSTVNTGTSTKATSTKSQTDVSVEEKSTTTTKLNV